MTSILFIGSEHVKNLKKLKSGLKSKHKAKITALLELTPYGLL